MISRSTGRNVSKRQRRVCRHRDVEPCVADEERVGSFREAGVAPMWSRMAKSPHAGSVPGLNRAPSRVAQTTVVSPLERGLTPAAHAGSTATISKPLPTPTSRVAPLPGGAVSSPSDQGARRGPVP